MGDIDLRWDAKTREVVVNVDQFRGHGERHTVRIGGTDGMLLKEYMDKMAELEKELDDLRDKPDDEIDEEREDELDEQLDELEDKMEALVDKHAPYEDDANL